MLLCVMPVAFAAETVNYIESGDLDAESVLNGTIASDVEMTIPENEALVIAGGQTLTVEAQGTLEVLGSLTIEKNGTLVIEAKNTSENKEAAILNVLGTVKVEKGGTLDVKGTVVHSERVTCLGTSKVYYHFPNLSGTALGQHIAAIKAGYADDGSSYADVSGKVEWNENLKYGGDFVAPLNSVVYIATQFNQKSNPDGTVVKVLDDAKFPVYLDTVAVPFVQGVHMTTADASVDVTYGKWSDTDYIWDYSFYVPSGSGYIVHSDKGETSKQGAIKVAAGADFRFRVEIDGSYDMSKYEVYVYEGYAYDNATGQDKIDNGKAVKMVADENGYYTVSSVYSDYTIYVTGVVSNEAIERTSSILDLLKNVINVFRTLFERIAGLLGINK